MSFQGKQSGFERLAKDNPVKETAGQGNAVKEPAFRITNTTWGYALRPTSSKRSGITMLQGISGFFGFLLIATSALAWVFRANLGVQGSDPLMIAFSGILCVVGLLFLRFSTQGSIYELHIDTARKQVREVLRNGKQQVFLLNSAEFEDIATVYIDRPNHADDLVARSSSRKPAGVCKLRLRYKDSGQIIEVAEGSENELEDLRDKLAGDLFKDREAALAEVVADQAAE